jgi:hypothetical protein
MRTKGQTLSQTLQMVSTLDPRTCQTSQGLPVSRSRRHMLRKMTGCRSQRFKRVITPTH